MKARFEKLMIASAVSVIGLTAHIASADLVAYWKFDESSGDTAFDSSGNAYDATVSRATWTTKGRFDGALNFSGGEYMSIPIGVLSSINKQITISMWQYGKSAGRFPQDDNPLSAWNHDKRILSIHLPWKDGKVYWEAGNGWVPRRPRVRGEVIRSDRLFKPAKAEEYQGRWNHWVFIKNADTGEMKMYLNGTLWCSGFDKTQRISGATLFNIGFYPAGNHLNGYEGFLDDMAIFDHALSKNEVAQLYSLGPTFFIPIPESLQVLIDTIQEAEVVTNEEKPQEAIAFLEDKIAECKQWRQENPNRAALHYRILSYDLYSLLAKAKQAMHVPQEEIADTYKHTIKSGLLSSENQARTLLWLYENVETKEYEKIIHFLLQNNSDYLKDVIAQAEIMVHQQKAKAAVRFLELNLDAYEQWREKHPFDNVVAEDRLPGIYFQLAKAKETVGAPKRDIADTYSRTFSPSRFEYTQEQTAALIWLLENESTNEYTAIINSCTQDGENKEPFANVVNNTCKHFELEKDRAKFERFLDTLFIQARHPFDWATFVESCLSDKTSRWAQEYYKYLENRPKLRFGWDWVAEKHVSNGDFRKAGQIYQEIIKIHDVQQNKSILQFRLCRCLFYGGEYTNAISALDSFIADNKVVNKNTVKEAMLIKGRAYLHLGQIDEAKENFIALMSEYPEPKNSVEPNFYTGYCHMQQGKFKPAAEVFDRIIEDYPDDLYASKARMCITRIKNVTQ